MSAEPAVLAEGPAIAAAPTTEAAASGMSRAWVNTASRYGSRLVSMGIGFALTPYLLHHLGAKALGLQVLASQAFQFCTLFGDACNRGYSRYAAVHYARGEIGRMNAVLSQGLVLSLVAAALVGLAAAAQNLFAGPLLGLDGDLLTAGRMVLALIAFGYLVEFGSGVWGAALFIRQQLYVLEVVNLGSRVAAAAAVVALFAWLPPSIVTWVLVTVLFAAAFRLFYMIPVAQRALPEMTLSLRVPMDAQLWSMLRFSFAGLVGHVGFLLYYASSSIVISHLPELGADKIIVYNLGQRWDPQVREVVLALAASLTPVFTALFATGNREGLQKAILAGTKQSLMLGLLPCLIFMIYAEPFLRLWVGPGYAREGAEVLRVCMVSVLATIPAIVNYEVLVAMGRVRTVAILEVLGGAVNVVLGIVFVRYCGLGLLGIALGNLTVRVVLTGLFIPYYACRWSGLGLRRYLSSAVVPAVLAALPAAAVGALWGGWARPATWLELFIQGSVVTICYAVSVAFIALTPSERRTLSDRLARVLPRAQRP